MIDQNLCEQPVCVRAETWQAMQASIGVHGTIQRLAHDRQRFNVGLRKDLRIPPRNQNHRADQNRCHESAAPVERQRAADPTRAEDSPEQQIPQRQHAIGTHRHHPGQTQGLLRNRTLFLGHFGTSAEFAE